MLVVHVHDPNRIQLQSRRVKQAQELDARVASRLGLKHRVAHQHADFL